MSAETERDELDKLWDLPVNQLMRIICNQLTSADDLDVPVTMTTVDRPGVLELTLVDDLDRQHDFTVTVTEGRVDAAETAQSGR